MSERSSITSPQEIGERIDVERKLWTKPLNCWQWIILLPWIQLETGKQGVYVKTIDYNYPKSWILILIEKWFPSLSKVFWSCASSLRLCTSVSHNSKVMGAARTTVPTRFILIWSPKLHQTILRMPVVWWRCLIKVWNKWLITVSSHEVIQVTVFFH